MFVSACCHLQLRGTELLVNCFFLLNSTHDNFKEGLASCASENSRIKLDLPASLSTRQARMKRLVSPYHLRLKIWLSIVYFDVFIVRSGRYLRGAKSYPQSPN
jgi:hypothetical protein